MTQAAEEFDPLRVAALLESGGEGMAWPERRGAALLAIEAISRHGATQPILTVIRVLAEDPKWEVRKVVGDGLLVLPEEDFQRLTAKFRDDSNAYVRRAAERALERRCEGQKLTDRRRKSGNAVRDQYTALADRYGVKAADQSMKMALQLYDLLVGSSVHEMRNVLTPLKSSARHVHKQIDAGIASPDLKRRVGTMLDWIGTLEQLLDDMRTYAQATPAERQSERLVSLVTQAQQMAVEWFHGKGLDISRITVELKIPEQIVVQVSRHQIMLAFKNIFKNAIDAFASDPTTFHQGQITVVGFMRSDGNAELSFTDTGMGLSPMELDELRRFIPGKSAKPHGSGYGLPTAQRRIAEHGGSLTINSVEDKGTTIVVMLPPDAEDGA